VLVQSPFSVIVYLVALLAIALPLLVRRVRSRRVDLAKESDPAR
jgi:hypothetical protein